LSFADKLRVNADLAALLRKEGKGSKSKASKDKEPKEKKERKKKDSDSDEPKAKRVVSAGTAAWQAFVKDCKKTMPERFTETTKEPERLKVCSAIKSEDMAAYDAFIADFKEKHAAAASAAASVADESEEAEELEEAAEAEEAEEAPTPKVEAPKPKAETPKPKAETPKPKVETPKPKVETPKPKAKAKEEPKAKEKKPVKKVAKESKESKEVKEESGLPIKTIDGKDYKFDPDTMSLWEIIEGGEKWTGYFQPGDEEPIRFTDGPE